MKSNINIRERFRNTALITLVLLVLPGSGCEQRKATDSKRAEPAKRGKRLKTAEDLGIETLGGVFTPLLRRGTQLPESVTETFSTASDDQTMFEIHLLTGVAPLAKDNQTLARIQITNVRAAKRGTPQIQITFAVTASGAVDVSAIDAFAPTHQLKLVRTLEKQMQVKVTPAGSRRNQPHL